MSYKKLLVFAAILASLLAGYFSFLISSIASYFLTKKASAQKEGEKGIMKSVKIYIGKYYLHFHHWLWSLALIFTPFTWKILPPSLHAIVLGFLTGITWQGVYCYSDWYKIIGKK